MVPPLQGGLSPEEVALCDAALIPADIGFKAELEIARAERLTGACPAAPRCLHRNRMPGTAVLSSVHQLCMASGCSHTARLATVPDGGTHHLQVCQLVSVQLATTPARLVPRWRRQEQNPVASLLSNVRKRGPNQLRK